MAKLDCEGVSSLIYSSTGIAKPPCCSTISIICASSEREKSRTLIDLLCLHRYETKVIHAIWCYTHYTL